MTVSPISNINENINQDVLRIADVEYTSRLLVGTGKYKDLQETRLAILASGAEIVTVAIRRTNIGQGKRSTKFVRCHSAPRIYHLAKYCRLL